MNEEKNIQPVNNESVQTKKKGNGGLAAIIIILLLVIVGLLVYIFYGDKLLKKEETSNDAQLEELSVDSDIVQYLYNLMSKETAKTYSFQFWKDNEYNKNNSDNKIPSDLYAESMSEEIKMNFVGYNLKEKDKEYILCSEIKPSISDLISEECLYQASTNYYSKSVVERTYNEIFGSSLKFNTNIMINLNWSGASVYYYDGDLNKYIYYNRQIGGTGGSNGYTTKINRAERDNNNIYIYEDVDFIEYDSDGKNILNETKFLLKYTFTKSNDLYKFESRIKVNQ